MDFASQNLTAGQLNAIVKKLGGEEGALSFLRGEMEVIIKKPVIDCDAAPFCPDGPVEEHREDGQFEWRKDVVHLYLSLNQQGGQVIEGTELHKELANKRVLNANVLDYLLKYPQLIPDEWKGKKVFFWGTVYCDPEDDVPPYVRFLHWNGSQWDWGCLRLDQYWSDVDPTALRVG